MEIISVLSDKLTQYINEICEQSGEFLNVTQVSFKPLPKLVVCNVVTVVMMCLYRKSYASRAGMSL